MPCATVCNESPCKAIAYTECNSSYCHVVTVYEMSHPNWMIQCVGGKQSDTRGTIVLVCIRRHKQLTEHPPAAHACKVWPLDIHCVIIPFRHPKTAIGLRRYRSG